MLKIFDVSCYDMTNMISLPAFTPGAACWIPSSTGLYSRVAVADKGSGLIRLFNADDSSGREEGQVTLHSAPVRCEHAENSITFISSTRFHCFAFHDS
jgi:hypothetical protein